MALAERVKQGGRGLWQGLVGRAGRAERPVAPPTARQYMRDGGKARGGNGAQAALVKLIYSSGQRQIERPFRGDGH